MVKRMACSLVVLAWCLALPGSAPAGAPAAALSIHSFATPSSFAEADDTACGNSLATCDSYRVTVTNVGSLPTPAGQLTIADTLPQGVTAHEVRFEWSGFLNENISFLCPSATRCEFPFALAPDATLTMLVYVMVEPGAAAVLTNSASVSGGGVAEASTSARNANGSAPPLFGVSAFDFTSFGLDGAADTQAAGHPYELDTRIDLNNVFRVGPAGALNHTSIHDLRDVVVDLPLGFLGSGLAAPQCTFAQLSSESRCPRDTTIGHILTEPSGGGTSVNSALWNMTPERGVAAEFGYIDTLEHSHVLYASVVPTAAGYVLRATSPDIPQVVLNQIVVSLYGNPAVRDESGNAPVPLVTNPSDCAAGPLQAAIHLDSWQSPGRYNADGTPDLSDPNWAAGVSESPPVTGCNQLRFDGSVSVKPDTTVASSPAGGNIELRVPQSEEPGSPATPPLRKAVVALPAGLTVNPSAAGGLQACSLAQIGLGSSGQPACPEASKLGVAEVSTPLLPGVLQGSLYLAAQGENPFGSLLAGYLVVNDPTTGVVIKLPGRIDLDPVSGQLTATFDELPQFPVGDLKLHIFGGPRSPFTTPAACGTYSTSATLTPWSAPDSGEPLTATDAFQVGSGCANGFSPAFAAGTVNNQAGAFSPFTATFSRGDEDQRFAGVSVTTPPGVLGIISGVERCAEPRAAQGTCGPGSLIGHATVAAGAGPDPFYVQGGQVFLTGPYKGAPFGLSVVVPAVAGPFNLGNVVVRAALEVDPHTTQITVVSDPLPMILQGVPLDVRTVNVTIDRSGFMFNPTSCEPLSVGATITSTQGAGANVSSRFQAANCASLAFKPSFTVSTNARTSKKNGAGLDVKVGYPSGSQANLHAVAVTLPKQLPSRLTTIQQACTEAAFAANPASCPAGSNIGIATAHTPVLANPLTGPAYLVSRGGAAFPDVEIVLQGEGVALDLVGSVDIKHGITHSAFNSVPDAPISSFELSLPEGPHSALAAVLPAKAKGSLCGTLYGGGQASLTMPTVITGQNGAVVRQNTKIAVTGCATAKKKPGKHGKAGKHTKTHANTKTHAKGKGGGRRG